MKTGYDQFFKKAKQTAAVQSRSQSIRNLKQKSKPKRKFPVTQLGIFLLFGLGGIASLDHLDEIEAQFKKIDITMGMAHAQDKVSPAEMKESLSDAKFLTPVGAAAPETSKEKKPDDADYLFKLAERKKTLDQREEDLNKMAAEIEKQKLEIVQQVKKIEETRAKISSVLEEKIKTDDAKVDTLVQMYSNMKPQQVAKVFETLDEDLVIEILSRMKKKVAGDILNLVKPEKAQIFAERFAGYRTPANQ